MTAGELFTGAVIHQRFGKVKHRLRYRVFMGLFDIDRLAELEHACRIFSWNRRGLVSFFDADHGRNASAPLRQQIEQEIARADLEPPEGPIRLLCMPRIAGYVFNPLSVYFCHDAQERLHCVVYEVNNTFGGRHFYVLSTNDDGEPLRHECAKDFPVSPFLPERMTYRFALRRTPDRIGVHITCLSEGAPLLTASFTGRSRPFTTGSLLMRWMTHPLLTWKVWAGIHWEAIWIWLKLALAGKQHPTKQQPPAPSKL